MIKKDENHDGLVECWRSRNRLRFDKWIRVVADRFNESDLTLERACRLVEVNPAEFEAVLQLAILDEEKLVLLAEAPPPQTTWFKFIKLDGKNIKKALDALNHRLPGQPPSSVLDDLLDSPVSRIENVAQLEAPIFRHLANKATRYGLLNDKSQKALSSFGKWRERNPKLSDKQAIWAEGLIEELIRGGAIKRNSQDNDSEICNQVLNLFGK
jgi:hypothetical protein